MLRSPISAVALALILGLGTGCHGPAETAIATKPSVGAADLNHARIVQADQEPGNWMSYGRSYSEQRFSPLKAVNDQNVNQLGLAWDYDLDTHRGQEATPLVIDGVMYFTTAWSKVVALNAATGSLLWTYDPQVNPKWAVNACCDVVNRGLAAWNGKLFLGTLDGRLTDLGGFARLGREGVDLLMSDSTNAEVPGIVTSERAIASVLSDVFSSAEQRIIVSCFSSHVHRVQQVLNVAAEHGRKVSLVGRSMVRNMGVARELGYLRVPSVPGGLLVDMRDAEELPPDEIVLISTGSQGEPMSALARMAGRDHPIRIARGDTVILASSLVPGNETAVSRVINNLTRLGARVVHKGNALVHVSGHAPAGELLYVLNMVKPVNFMPVHGEWRHLAAHADLAAQTGVPRENIVLAEDGVVVDLVGGKAAVAGKVHCGYVFVDGLSVGEVDESSIKDRLILGEEGFISVVVVVDSTNGKLVAGPEIYARGSGIDDDGYNEVLPLLEEALDRAAAEGINDTFQIGQLIRRTLGKWVSSNYRRRPMIVPVVLEV